MLVKFNLSWNLMTSVAYINREIKKVKVSRYMPWRRMGVEEV
jgi:hypothetical protein